MAIQRGQGWEVKTLVQIRCSWRSHYMLKAALLEKQGQATNRAIYNLQKDKYGINDFTYERGTMMR